MGQSEGENGSASAIVADELRAAVEAETLVQELAAPLDHLFDSRGKQLRAALVRAAAGTGPRGSAAAVRDGEIAVELLHLGTLAHDDVVDDGRLRRGSETVGVAYGNRASAFAGGVLLASAAAMMAPHGAEAGDAFAEAVTAICEGEMAEIEDLFNADRPLERYFEAISGKTAAGFAFAGWIGSWLAGADAAAAATTMRFGQEMGMAFQVLDDVLDLRSPAAETGKQRGKDLQQGVYTLPVIYASIDDPHLKRKLGRPIGERELEPLVQRAIAAGGVEKATEDCWAFAEKARAAIADAPDAARLPLLELLEAALRPLGQAAPVSGVSHA